MTDKDVLKELKAIAKEREQQEAMDPRWEKLCKGTLSPEEYSALEREAAQSDEAAVKFAALKPLGADFERAMTDRLVSMVSADSTHETRASEQAPQDSFLQRMQDWVANVIAQNQLAFGSMATAAVAVAAFVALQPATLSELPAYSMEISRGDQLMRSQPSKSDGIPKFSQGSRLQLTLRPEKANEAAVTAYAFVDGADGLVTWPVQPSITSQGSVRLQGTIGKNVPVTTGRHKIVVVVAPTTDTLKAETVKKQLSETEIPENWQVFRTAIEVTD